MAEDPSLIGVVGVIVLVTCYLMPTIVALACDKCGAGGIALVNFFLGWTVIRLVRSSHLVLHGQDPP
jgi:hypothetical protein